MIKMREFFLGWPKPFLEKAWSEPSAFFSFSRAKIIHLFNWNQVIFAVQNRSFAKQFF
jgi:hypothetical protein